MQVIIKRMLQAMLQCSRQFKLAIFSSVEVLFDSNVGKGAMLIMVISHREFVVCHIRCSDVKAKETMQNKFFLTYQDRFFNLLKK